MNETNILEKMITDVDANTVYEMLLYLSKDEHDEIIRTIHKKYNRETFTRQHYEAYSLLTYLISQVHRETNNVLDDETLLEESYSFLHKVFI